jgi:hypothetical protein
MSAEVFEKKVCWLYERAGEKLASQSYGRREDETSKKPMGVSSKDSRWTSVNGEA